MDFSQNGFLNSMKKQGLLSMLLVFSSSLVYAQEIKKDSGMCNCIVNIPFSYPDIADEDRLQGKVIIEYEIDSACHAGNPKIIQSLGPAYDKEALKVANLVISQTNKCHSKCKPIVCIKRKVQLPFSFTNAESVN